MTGLKLIQFRCEKKGHLFYFQGYAKFVLRQATPRCPFCLFSRVAATGREYPAIDERNAKESSQ